MKFENIKNIDIANPSSWQDRVFVTFDIDWCSDEVLSYTLDIIEKYNIKATFFVTHKTNLLARMRANQNIELGIHPNFNPLLNGDFRYGNNIDEVIEYYKKIVPDALSIRSHSLTVNSHMLNAFEKHGLKYECNQYIPLNSNIKLYPYKHINSIIRVPHFWEDDLHCVYKDSWDIDTYLKYDGLKVFDFHPIHVFLNTEHLDRYENSREWHNSRDELLKHIYNGFGIKSFLENLEKLINLD